jgi:hypothetical protein
MRTIEPICPDCGGRFSRLEYLVDEDDHGYTSGFCHPCAKHTRLCNKVFYMSSCVRRNGHDGNHITNDIQEFVDDGVSHPYQIHPVSFDQMKDVVVRFG